MIAQTNGKIVDIKVSAGDFTGETASFMIADMLQNLYFWGEITEEESELLSAGDLVNLSFRNGKVKLEDCEIKSVTAADSDEVYQIEIPLSTSEVTIGEIEQQNESYAAVLDSGLTSEARIVIYTNQELYGGQIVRIG